MANPEPEFIAPRRRKDNNRDIDAEIGNLQPVTNVDMREPGTTDQLIGIEEVEIDLELIGPFGIRQAKIDSQLLMLEGK